MSNPLVDLQQQGQSVWLDYIRRKSLLEGDVKKLISEDGLRGMTANPSIFQVAIAAGDDYDQTIEREVRAGAEPIAIYEALAVEDIQTACDQFRSVYDATDGLDGYVSLEVAPGLARDTQGTIEEARRLWKWVDRPNLMIKVPGLKEGVPAIETLLSEGINVNVTLLFAIEAYEAVAWAYIRACERRVAEGKPIDRLASVASFFVSRVDVMIDPMLDKMAAAETDAAKKAKIQGLRGKAAIANARLAYQSFKTIFGDKRFTDLKAHGARVQRPLWASTSVKDKAYSDLLYADALIGPDTVDTMPRETLEAFRDHGTVVATVENDIAGAKAALAGLARSGSTSSRSPTSLRTRASTSSCSRSMPCSRGSSRSARRCWPEPNRKRPHSSPPSGAKIGFADIVAGAGRGFKRSSLSGQIGQQWRARLVIVGQQHPLSS
jgi:transaldolase